MIIFKILAVPLVVVLALLAAVSTFLLCVAAVCEIVCVLLVMWNIVAPIAGQTTGCIAIYPGVPPDLTCRTAFGETRQ